MDKVVVQFDFGDDIVTFTVLSDGSLNIEGFDEETELAAIELGFEPSLSFMAYEILCSYDIQVEAYDLIRSRKPFGDSDELGEDARKALINAGVLAALLMLGVDPNEIDDDGRTLLFAATIGKHLTAVENLLAFGADPNIGNGGPIIVASAMGNIEIVNALIAAGANVRANGNRALRAAVSGGKIEVIKTLLQNGADPLDPGVCDKTPAGFVPRRSATTGSALDIARDRFTANQKYKEIVELLKSFSGLY